MVELRWNFVGSDRKILRYFSLSFLLKIELDSFKSYGIYSLRQTLRSRIPTRVNLASRGVIFIGGESS
jgi:alkylated DNA repair dioxygenase AlkB